MSYQYSLEARCKRSKERADQGDITILIVGESEKAVAKQLIGSSPVIVATGPEALQFLRNYAASAFGGKRRGR